MWPDRARMNRDDLAAACAAGGLGVIWVDEGHWLRADARAEIKRQTGPLVVH